jgi:hypothetical protein
VAKELREFTQAVLDEKTLTQEARQELLEQLEAVSTAATNPAAAKKSVLKPVLLAIAATAGTIETLASAWSKLEPLIHRLFA